MCGYFRTLVIRRQTVFEVNSWDLLIVAQEIAELLVALDDLRLRGLGGLRGLPRRVIAAYVGTKLPFVRERVEHTPGKLEEELEYNLAMFEQTVLRTKTRCLV